MNTKKLEQRETRLFKERLKTIYDKNGLLKNEYRKPMDIIKNILKGGKNVSCENYIQIGKDNWYIDCSIENKVKAILEMGGIKYFGIHNTKTNRNELSLTFDGKKQLQHINFDILMN